jgi:hypothetical protein
MDLKPVHGRTSRSRRGHGEQAGGEPFFCQVGTPAEGPIAFTEFPALWTAGEFRSVPSALRKAASSTCPPKLQKASCSTRSTRTTASAASASWASASTHASTAACGTSTRREDERHRPSRARSGLSSRSEARTSRPSTWTSSRTCAQATHRTGRQDRSYLVGIHLLVAPLV